MRKTRRLAYIFLLLFALTTVVTAFHRHEDGCDHSNCPICMAAHRPAAVAGIFSLEIQQFLIGEEIPPAPLWDGFARISPLFSRAPPA